MALDTLETVISAWQFHCQFLFPNLPCLLGQQYTSDWPCRSAWLNTDGSANLQALSHFFGSRLLPVVTETAEYGAAETTEMSFDTFVARCSSTPPLYMKDYHLCRDVPSGSSVYHVPAVFCSDWLNEFWDYKDDEVEKDYRFIYVGSRHSTTPLHADVFRSYSWSANVVGRKRWRLLPKGKEKSLCGRTLEELGEAEKVSLGLLDFVQEAGQILFVPSGWFHEVYNLDEFVVSINHNWLNGCNIQHLCDYVLQSTSLVDAELVDCRTSFSDDEYRQKREAVLKADIGIDVQELRRMLGFTRSNRKSNSNMAECCACGLAWIDCASKEVCAKELTDMQTDCTCTCSCVCVSCWSLIAGFDSLALNWVLEKHSVFHTD